MQWEFEVKFNLQPIKLRAEQIYCGDSVDRYRVTGRNRSLIFQTNAPLLRKLNLKHKRWEWKLYEGTLTNQYLLEQIPKLLESYIKKQDKPTGRGGMKPYKK